MGLHPWGAQAVSKLWGTPRGNVCKRTPCVQRPHPHRGSLYGNLSCVCFWQATNLSFTILSGAPRKRVTPPHGAPCTSAVPPVGLHGDAPRGLHGGSMRAPPVWLHHGGWAASRGAPPVGLHPWGSTRGAPPVGLHPLGSSLGAPPAGLFFVWSRGQIGVWDPMGAPQLGLNPGDPPLGIHPWGSTLGAPPWDSTRWGYYFCPRSCV